MTNKQQPSYIFLNFIEYYQISLTVQEWLVVLVIIEVDGTFFLTFYIIYTLYQFIIKFHIVGSILNTINFVRHLRRVKQLQILIINIL